MGRDYYGILSVPRTASPAEVRAGYCRAAAKWHPQRNPSAKVEAEQRFRDISEAYDVLIDPLRRQRYDERGEAGLKFPPAGSGLEPYQYVGDPFALFANFFANATPLSAAYEAELENLAPSLSTKEVEPPVEVEVGCSLSELTQGTTRRLTIERTRLGPTGSPYKESKLVTLPVRPGWQPGMRITFRGEGNHTCLEKQPGDLIVLIAERGDLWTEASAHDVEAQDE